MADKLFVGGLSFSTSSERLREIFAEAGRVDSATVVTDRQTGQSRGFGFVEMATPEDADAAISRFNGAKVDGRQLKVERSQSTGAKRGGGGGPRPRRRPRLPPLVASLATRQLRHDEGVQRPSRSPRSP